MDEIKTTQIVEEQDLSEILRIRREKLENLKNAGKNPFEKGEKEQAGRGRETAVKIRLKYKIELEMHCANIV